MPNDKNRLYTNDDLNKDSKDIAKRRTSPQFSRFTTATSTSLAALSLNPPSPAVQIESNPQIGIPINDSYGSLGLITQIIPLNVYGSSYSIITVTDDVTFAFEGIPKGRHIEFTLDILIDKEELPLPIINLTENNLLNPPTLPPLENGTRLILHFEGVNDSTGLRFVYLGGTVLGSGLVFPINYPEHDGGTLQNITQILDFADANRHSRKYSLEGDVTFAFDNPPTDKTATVFIQVVQDAIGGHTVSFPPGTINKDVVEGGIKEGANESTIVKIVYFFGVFYAYLESVGGGGLNVDLSNLAEANAIPFDLNINLKSINNVDTINFINNRAEITGLRALRFIATEENPINLFTAPNTLTIKTVDSLRFSFAAGLLFEMSNIGNVLSGPNILLSGFMRADNAIIEYALHFNANDLTPPMNNGEIKRVEEDLLVFTGNREVNLTNVLDRDLSNVSPINQFPEMVNLHMNHNRILEVGGVDFDTAGILQGLNKIIFDQFAYEIFRDGTALRYRAENFHRFYFDFNLVWEMNETVFSGPNIILSGSLALNPSLIQPIADGQISVQNAVVGSDVFIHSGTRVRNVSEFLDRDLSNISPTNQFPAMTNLHMNHNQILEVGGIDFDTAGTLQGLDTITFDGFQHQIFKNVNNLRYRTDNKHQFYFDFNLGWDMSEFLLEGRDIVLSGSMIADNEVLNFSLRFVDSDLTHPNENGQIKRVQDNLFVYSGDKLINLSDFKTLVAGDNITFNETLSQITINAEGGGGGGANTSLSNLVGLSINQPLRPDPDMNLDIGQPFNPWDSIFAKKYQIFQGGGITSSNNMIASNNFGMIFNTPGPSDFKFLFGGSARFSMGNNTFKFLNVDVDNPTAIIKVTQPTMEIRTRTENDRLEVYLGMDAIEMPTQTIEYYRTTFRGKRDDSQAYDIQIIQNSDFPQDDRTIGNIYFWAKNSSRIDTVFAQISATSSDVTGGTEDGLLQLGVVSDGIIAGGINIEGGGGGGARLGFFGRNAISQPQVSGSLANLIDTLVNLGLVRR